MFEGRNSRGSLLEAYRHVYRRRLRLLRVLGVALFVAGAVLVFVGDFRVGIVYVVGGLGLAVVGPFAAAQAGVKASWRVAGLQTTYTLTGDGVHTRNALVETDVAWAEVAGADRLPGQYLLRLGGLRFLALPVGELPPHQREQVDELLSARDLLPAEPAEGVA
jgi:drug/metabolite transporter (DMT)-like permease